MSAIDGMPTGYNIGWHAQGNRCVTTGAIPRSNPFGWRLIFETLIWEWDGKERGNIVNQIHHCSKNEAIKVHGYIVNNLKGVITDE